MKNYTITVAFEQLHKVRFPRTTHSQCIFRHGHTCVWWHLCCWFCFSFLCCAIMCLFDLCIQPRFGSSLLPVVCLIYIICFCLRSGSQHILCCIFVFVLCTLCYQYLWIILFDCPFVLPVSLDYLFWLPLLYSLTFICPVSCVPSVASISGLSFAPSVFSNVYISPAV